MNHLQLIPGDTFLQGEGAVNQCLYWQQQPLDFGPSTILFRRLLRAALYERTTLDGDWIRGLHEDRTTITFKACCEAIGLDHEASRDALLKRISFDKKPKQYLKAAWDAANRAKIQNYRRRKRAERQKIRSHKVKVQEAFMQERRERRQRLKAAPRVLANGAASTIQLTNKSIESSSTFMAPLGSIEAAPASTASS